MEYLRLLLNEQMAFLTLSSPLDEISFSLGPNNLPYNLPIHPNLVHFTIGLFAIAITFDIAGALYPLEKRILRFLALPVTRLSFHDVGWYNILASCAITFLTVATGIYEMLLAAPIQGVKSSLGLGSMPTMIMHGVGGAILLLLIVIMTVWRGFQRFAWRRDLGRQVSWSYLLSGVLILVILAVHGTLGAELAAEFGVHITADQLLAAGADLNEVLP